jgi:hypothetical protein
MGRCIQSGNGSLRWRNIHPTLQLTCLQAPSMSTTNKTPQHRHQQQRRLSFTYIQMPRTAQGFRRSPNHLDKSPRSTRTRVSFTVRGPYTMPDPSDTFSHSSISSNGLFDQRSPSTSNSTVHIISANKSKDTAAAQDVVLSTLRITN